jgi:hypothetical protein
MIARSRISDIAREVPNIGQREVIRDGTAYSDFSADVNEYCDGPQRKVGMLPNRVVDLLAMPFGGFDLR